jgi:hypothetical protein
MEEAQMNENARIIVRYFPPRFGKPVEIWLDVDPFQAAPFDPLSRDRELYGEPIIGAAFTKAEREAAQRQLMDRAKLTEYLAPRLADALAKVITQQDPVNGYSPEELK